MKSNHFDKFPLFKHARPMIVRVSAGESLFIPEGWFHQVDSSSGTIAINFWWKGLVSDSNSQLLKGSKIFIRVLMENLIQEEKQHFIHQFLSNEWNLYLQSKSLLELSNLLLETCFLKKDSTQMSYILINLDFGTLQDVFLSLSASHSQEFQLMMETLSPCNISILTHRFETCEKNSNSAMGSFYEKLFSLWKNQEVNIIESMLNREEKFSRDALKRIIDSLF